MNNKINLINVYVKLCIFLFLFTGIFLFLLSGFFNNAVDLYEKDIVKKENIVKDGFLLVGLYKNIFLYFNNDDVSESFILDEVDKVDKSLFYFFDAEGNKEFSSFPLKEMIVSKNHEVFDLLSNDIEKLEELSKNNDTSKVFLYFNELVFSFLFLFFLFLVLSFYNFRRNLKSDVSLIKASVKKIISWDLDFDINNFNYFEFDEINDLLLFLNENQLTPAKDMKLKFNQVHAYFLESSKAALVLDENHKIIDANRAFMSLWSESREEVSTLLDIDSDNIDDVIGEYISEVHFISLAETDHKVLLESGVYSLDHSEITKNGSLLGYIVGFDFISEKIELDVIYKSIHLMKSGVWNIPVRVKRDQSSLSKMSQGLEEIRLQLLSSSSNSGHLTSDSDLLDISEYDELDELDGFEDLAEDSAEADLDVEVSINNDSLEEDHAGSLSVVYEPIENTEAYLEWQNRLKLILTKVSNELIDNIESSVLLGYENMVQKLHIVHKDMQASSRALNDSTRYLNEVRAVILKALILEQSKGELDRSSLAKDINHDVDTVIVLLNELSEDEEKTIDVFRAEVDVAELRKSKAHSCLNDFEFKLIESFMDLSEEIVKPIFIQQDKSNDSKSNDDILGSSSNENQGF